MRRILVTNDDGYRSDGIRALADVLAPLGEVTIVAPIQEASAVGHGLTLRQPLRIDVIAERISDMTRRYGAAARAVNRGRTARYSPVSIPFPAADSTYHSAPNASTPWPAVCPGALSPENVYSGCPLNVIAVVPSLRVVVPSFDADTPVPAIG